MPETTTGLDLTCCICKAPVPPDLARHIVAANNHLLEHMHMSTFADQPLLCPQCCRECDPDPARYERP